MASNLLEFFHKLTLCYDCAADWKDISVTTNLYYEECEGDLLLQWGDKGFKTILDVLMVPKQTCPDSF